MNDSRRRYKSMADNIEVEYIDIIAINIGERLRRSLNPETVERIKQSIEKIGLKTPISVRDISDEEGWLLVAGHHRLQACIELGWKEIPARIERGSETDARLWEIAENLHRAELTALERDEHIAEWLRLTKERAEVSCQVDTKPSQSSPNGGRPDGGINAAARELGISQSQAHRAVRIDNLSPEAKDEARVLGLDNNHTALLRAAKMPSADKQIQVLRNHIIDREAREANEHLLMECSPPLTPVAAHASDRRIDHIIRAIEHLPDNEFAIVCKWFDEYRIDRSKGSGL